MKRKELLSEMKAGHDLTREQIILETQKIALQAAIHKVDPNKILKDAKTLYDIIMKGFENNNH